MYLSTPWRTERLTDHRKMLAARGGAIGQVRFCDRSVAQRRDGQWFAKVTQYGANEAYSFCAAMAAQKMKGTTLVLSEPWRARVIGDFERALAEVGPDAIIRIQFYDGGVATSIKDKWCVAEISTGAEALDFCVEQRARRT